MHTCIKASFLFYTSILFVCLNSFFLPTTTAQVSDGPGIGSASENYTFESIDVPGVEFLALTASSDFEDYAGYTKSADGEKEVAFTLIDGVFMTYDFPGAQNTYFYALGNDGRAAGYYEDSEGLHHGVILEDGEWRQYDFPDAVQTEIYGISDATGVLTGNWIDAAGVRRGFTGDIILEFPGATATFADFVNSAGNLFGSYIDADGIFQEYAYSADGRYIPFDLANAENLEFFYVHGYNDAKTRVARGKVSGDVTRTYLGTFVDGLRELKIPGSVSTEGYNINQDGSVVGFYDTPDGRRHGFIAKPIEVIDQPVFQTSGFNYTYESIDVPGVEFLALTASSDFEDYAGYTKSADGEKMVAFTLIDGVFMTYDFPGSQNTYFFALGNNGNAAGYYEDSEGKHRGIVLENGELRQYDFPGAVETEIYGISDATGALTGNFIDASGVRRGFTRDIIVEYPGASETFADFINASGGMVGSYVGDDGTYTPYLRSGDGRYVSFDLPTEETYEFFYVHGQTDTKISVARGKVVDDVPRTYVGSFLGGLHELKFPGSVSTEGYNINQDASVVGHYAAADGRVHGFIARPVAADTPPQMDDAPSVVSVSDIYTFETIEVPGVNFLEVAASNDFGDYAGNTRSPDGKKTIGFTLIGGVFTTYDFPGSVNTYFYALDNTGKAAGHYKDMDGLYHGVILENGELHQYDFPGAAETHIYGLSDETGALSGNIVDAAGVSHAFSGELTITFPGAVNTYGDFVNAAGAVVGSYTDADGMPHGFIRNPDGSFTTIDLPKMPNLEFLFVNTITDAGVIGFRAKATNDILRSYLLLPDGTLYEVRFPGSVSTVVRNVNQDGSMVGYYDLTDGQRYGFVGRPTTQLSEKDLGNTFSTHFSKGLNMLSVPLKPTIEMTARSLAVKTGATAVVTLDASKQKFIGWTPNAPDDGFPIEGAKGYIVNIPQARDIVFTGTKWTNQVAVAAAPGITRYQTWAFIVSGYLRGTQHFNEYLVTIRNKRTNTVMTTRVRSNNYFAAATADLNYRGVVELGDRLELTVTDTHGNIVSERFNFTVNPMNLANAVLNVTLEGIGIPKRSLLLQNYPNPFNPETWIPYQLSEDTPVSISIYDTTGKLVRTLSLGFQSTGFYNSREHAAYWDGRNDLGERVASGVYFYQLVTPTFQQTQRMLIVK